MMSLGTALHALGGGLLIGAGAALLLLLNGRVAGVSGILANVVETRIGEQGWRPGFLLGLLIPALVLGVGQPQLPGSWTLAMNAGLLVGIGTRLGSGCTSGHGVCGLANLSRRSLAATVMFMLTAALTVWVARHGVAT
jgi:uncharacterized membrane protein YedE/YeeE